MSTIRNLIDRHRFAAVWGGELVSLVGSTAAAVVISLVVYERTHSVTLLSLVVAARFATSIYLAPIAGAIADHFARRKVIVSCDALLALCSFGLAVLAADEAIPIGGVVVLVALSGAVGAGLSVSLSASVRQLRSEADLTRVNGVTSLLETLPVLVGPVLGALLYSVADPSWVFAIDAMTFIVAGVLVLSVRGWQKSAPEPPAGKRRLRPFGGALVGLRWIWERPEYRRLQLTFSAVNFCNGFGAALVTAYVLSAATTRPEWNLAFYNVMSSVGLLVGSLVVVALAGRASRPVLIAGAVMVGAVIGRLGLGVVAAPVMWGVTGLIRNASAQTTNAPLTAIWQERVPETLQGTVFGARRLLGQGPYPIAVILGGLAVDRLPRLDAGSLAAQLIPRLAGPTGSMTLMLIVLAVGESLLGLRLLRSAVLRDASKDANEQGSARV